MARIRTIQPDFAQSPSMRRVPREARLLFVLLWTITDDAGRCEAHPDDLVQILYPSDFDAATYILGWLDALELEGCIERYTVDDIDYLRIVRWHKHQQIDHPSPSHLPPSPNERPEDSRIRERSRKRRRRGRESAPDQAPAAPSIASRESHDFSAADTTPVVITQQGLLRHLERIRASAEADGSHANALRSIAMQAQLGLATGKAAGQEEVQRRSPRLSETVPRPANPGRETTPR
jgi:hypothetical protein